MTFRDKAAIEQLRRMVLPVADEPLWPSAAPMDQRAMQEILVRGARLQPPGSPERAELCCLFIETARFQPLAEQASRDLEAMFTPGNSPGTGDLRYAAARLQQAERQVATGRETLRQRLVSLGLVKRAGEGQKIPRG